MQPQIAARFTKRGTVSFAKHSFRGSFETINQVTQLNPRNLPEIALVGRSNCGKSSLLNALLGNKKLAKTSKTPGRTQSGQSFLVKPDQENQQFFVVDLPGYGFANVPTKIADRMTKLVGNYIEYGPNLRRIFLLADLRRGLTPYDESMMEMFHTYGLPYQVVMTKMDKIPEQDQEKHLVEASTIAAAMSGFDVVPTSSKTGNGINRLRWGILEATYSPQRKVFQGEEKRMIPMADLLAETDEVIEKNKLREEKLRKRATKRKGR